jgi:hypothetical protein
MVKKITEQELEVFESGTEGHPMSRVQVLEDELQDLKNEKKMMEIEKGLNHLMEEMHPSRRAKATKALKEALGGIRGSPESRTKRRAEIKSGVSAVIKFLKENKAKRESSKYKPLFTFGEKPKKHKKRRNHA